MWERKCLINLGQSMQTSQTLIAMMAKSELKLMKQTYKTKLEQMEQASHGEPIRCIMVRPSLRES
jgi:hypothetical protein